MKYTGMLALFLLLSSPLKAAPEEKTYSLALSEPGQPVSLDVEMYNGSVHVMGYDGVTVEVTAQFSPLSAAQLKGRAQHYHNTSKVKELEKPRRSVEGLKPVRNVSLNLEIEERKNRVVIQSQKGSYNVTLVVQVPRTAQVEIDIHEGEYVKVEDITGALEVETFRGDIEFINIQGPVVAETHAHDIVASFVDFNESAPSSFTTFAGDIDVTFSKDVAMTLNLRNYQGEILSGLDNEFKTVDSVEQKKGENKQKIVLGAQLSTQINGGKQALTINSYSGDMYLRKAD